MAAKLRLATRTATLEDLEESQQNQRRRPIHQSPEKSPAQGVTGSLTRTHCHVAQILYAKDVQKNYPAWKRWVANNIHIPLFRWFEKSLGLFPPTGERIDGVYVWASHQGCFESEAEAKADADRYPHGYVVPNMPLGRSLTASVAEKSSIYFATRKGLPKADAKRISEWIAQVDRIQETIDTVT